MQQFLEISMFCFYGDIISTFKGLNDKSLVSFNRGHRVCISRYKRLMPTVCIYNIIYDIQQSNVSVSLDTNV